MGSSKTKWTVVEAKQQGKYLMFPDYLNGGAIKLPWACCPTGKGEPPTVFVLAIRPETKQIFIDPTPV